MPDHLGDDMRKTKAEDPDEKEKLSRLWSPYKKIG